MVKEVLPGGGLLEEMQSLAGKKLCSEAGL